MTKALESLLYIKAVLTAYLEIVTDLMPPDHFQNVKAGVKENISTLTMEIGRLIKYEEVLSQGKRFTIPNPDADDWHVSDALDTLADIADLNPNDIPKFPLWDLLKEEEKLAKLEDIYEEAHTNDEESKD